jgi:hypothetical protein
MTPLAATAPTPDVVFMLGQLMERTEGLPQLKKDLAGVIIALAALQEDFETHRIETNDELRRIRNGAARTRTWLTNLRTEWKVAIALTALFSKELLEQAWKRLAH